MDIDIIYNDINLQFFTDCVLTIKDQQQTITLTCHKIILSSSKYFRDMFRTNHNEKNIYFDVADATVMRDVILSMYGKKCRSNGCPEWKYQLLTIKYKDYLLMDYDLTPLYSLSVPENKFDMLIEVASLQNILVNQKLLSLLKRNLPIDFDLTNYPEKLKNRLIKKNLMTIIGQRSLAVYDIDTGDKITVIYSDFEKTIDSSITSDNNYVVTIGGKKMLIWDLKSGQIVRKIDHINLRAFKLSNNNRFIFVGYADKYYYNLNIINFESGEVIRELLLNRCWRFFEISNDGLLTIATSETNNCNIVIWNNETGKIYRGLIGHTDTVLNVAITNDKKFLVSCSDDRTIRKWDIEDGVLIYTTDDIPTKCVYIPNNNRYIVSIESTNIIIRNFDTGLVIRRIYTDAYISRFKFYDNYVARYRGKYCDIYNADDGTLVRSCKRESEKRILYCGDWSKPSGKLDIQILDDDQPSVVLGKF